MDWWNVTTTNQRAISTCQLIYYCKKTIILDYNFIMTQSAFWSITRILCTNVYTHKQKMQNRIIVILLPIFMSQLYSVLTFLHQLGLFQQCQWVLLQIHDETEWCHRNIHIVERELQSHQLLNSKLYGLWRYLQCRHTGTQNKKLLALN